MDVTCPSCSTEYEFDETLLSPTGTPVRCGQCQHAFRVAAHRAVAEGWRVRRDDGLVLLVSSLTDLRERIRRGELGPHDQIARDGETFKPLGEIVELESTFSAARTARKFLPRGVERRPHYEVTARQGRAARAARAPDVDAGAEARDGTPTTPRAQATPGAQATAGAQATRPAASTKRPRLLLDLGDEPAPRRRSSAGTVFVWLALAGAVAYGTLAYVERRTEQETRARLAALEAQLSPLALDTYDAYRSVAAELTTALARPTPEPAALSAYAQCQARWAELLADEARVEPDRPRAAALRSRADERRAEAERAEAAAEAAGGTPRAAPARDARPRARALAEALSRAEGVDPVAVRAAVEALRALSPDHPLLRHAAAATTTDGGVP